MRLVKFLSVLVAAAGVVALVFVYAPAMTGQRPERGDRERAARDLMTLHGPGVGIGATVRDADSGVVVADVRHESAAEKAGLKPGDVIVEFDGEHVRSARQFTRLVAETAPDRTVKTVVQREGRRTELQIKPEPWSANAYFDSARLADRLSELGESVGRIPYDFDFDFDLPGARGRLGVTVQALTPQLAGYFGVKDGVLVSSVAEDSPAARAGVKAGDVITAVGGDPIRSRADLTRGVRRSDGEVTLTVTRDRKELTLKAKVEERPRTTRRSR